ncbi:DEAD/DEAH box helicase family protein [Ascidiimonas sp. W6]|uniref:DEAD/DEAH box helicase family protein n=1 Tax=Ascidiimonas meishanensis TaxID=3128903 RepID=UPI0030EF2DA0
MPNFLDDLQFKFPWRSYQTVFLENLEKHSTDQHLHLIAPPGSGKTILGLEIVRRINKKTLVLAPTLTIRNQWKDRLSTFFTHQDSFKKYSFDIKKPNEITFSTYQSLHAFFKSFDEKKDFFSFFHDHDIECIVLDEAHHLKNEWWKCLIALKEDKLFTVVALTATPPYDSEQLEISRYFNLCGPVDEEIAVPSLVKEGDLCPHQDYVYFSTPEEATIEAIVRYRRKISDFVDQIKEDSVFLNFLKSHRFYAATEEAFDDIYKTPEYFSSLLIFLNASGIEIPRAKLKVLGFDNEKIEFPALDYQWVETLFQHLLIRDRENMLEAEDYLKKLEGRLRKLSILESGNVNIVGDDKLYRSLANSPVKMKSIVEICASEYQNLGNQLRCVVLTDYIRKEFLKTPDDLFDTINRIGVVPIFRYLRKHSIHKSSLGILSGSLVLVHKNALADRMVESSFNKHYGVTEWEIDKDFVIISAKTSGKTRLTSMVTSLFEKGAIKILIGTKSLLGEGWDAPSINSLILASFVGSFVTSNQMRGRAIRSQNGNKNKTGIIWHLASVDPTIPDGGKDIAKLKRRFKAFVGISESEPAYIENGFERLDLPEIFEVNRLENLNEATLVKSRQRALIAEKWQNAVAKGSGMLRELKLGSEGKYPYQKQKKLYYRDAVMYTFFELLIGISFFLPEFLLRNFKILMEKGILYFVYILLIALALGFGRKFWKALSLLVRFGTRHTKVDNIAKVIVSALAEMGYLTTLKETVSIETEVRSNGEVICIVGGCSDLEGELIIKALEEVVDEIRNPRYLLTNKNWFRKQVKTEQQYPVPEIFGGKKEYAQLFQQHWKAKLGKTKLIFTRNPEGRKLLVRARIYHISNAFKKKTRKAVIWR